MNQKSSPLGLHFAKLLRFSLVGNALERRKGGSEGSEEVVAAPKGDRRLVRGRGKATEGGSSDFEERGHQR